MNQYEIVEKCLNISPKVRFVGIYDNGQLYHKTQNNIQTYLSPSETERSCIQALLRYKTRLLLSDKIGKLIWSITMYEKLYRVTIPMRHAVLMLISMELSSDPISICTKIIEIINESNFNLE